MQAAQNTLLRFGMIILHKVKGDASCRKALFLITLQHKAALIGKDFGFDQYYIWNGCGYETHADTFFL